MAEIATVEAILALLSTAKTLHPVTDELRTRVQSIRVRSLQESVHHDPGRRAIVHATDAPWRNKSHASTFTATRSTAAPVTNHWRKTTGTPEVAKYTRPVAAASAAASAVASAVASAAAAPSAAPSAAPVVASDVSISRFTPVRTSVQQQHTRSGIPLPARYISKFHSGAKTGDDQILNTVILNKLNIFSVQTYDDVKQFLFQILGSDQKFIREFTWLVFRKAAAEEKFCGLFAKLLSEIKKEYPVILEEMRNLHTTYLDIWDSTDTTSTVDRRCRLGYSQFMAELTALGVLESSTMRQTLEMLKKCIVRCLNDAQQQETVEEYMDCLRQLCGSKVPSDVRSLLREILVADLETWIALAKDENPGLSSKSRFACMDLRDLLVKSK